MGNGRGVHFFPKVKYVFWHLGRADIVICDFLNEIKSDAHFVTAVPDHGAARNIIGL